MSRLRLIVFDVDGTLADSQAEIVAAMTRAFEGLGVSVPARADILGIVGLSLDQAIEKLAPQQNAQSRAALVQGYRQAYFDLRQANGVSPLYPGAREMLDNLAGDPWTLLGVATGKSKRGLDALIAGHDLNGVFITRQVADHHPSKPHPSMLQTALRETGVDAADAVMIGDTSYDMDMAAAAGIAGIGVSWGYHPREALARATTIIDSFSALPAALDRIWENRS